MKLKVVSLWILFAAGIIAVCSSCSFGQSRTNRLYRPCPASTSRALVETQRDGDIDLVACSGRSVLANGTPLTQSDSVVVDVQSYASLAAAVTAVGATKRTLAITQDSACSTAITVPATLVFEFTNKARIVKSTGCTINFQGIGLADPESQIAAFSGFASGDITWTGATADLRPSAVSTELWDTRNTSLSDRLDRADKAFADGTFIKIVLYPRVITARVVTRTKREIFFTPGDYINTMYSWDYGPFEVSSYTLFHGTQAARIFEPGHLSAAFTAASATNINAGTGVITITAHPFTENMAVSYVNATPANAIGGLPPNVAYYAKNVTANTFQLSHEGGGAPITFSSVGTGNQTFYIAPLGARMFGASSGTSQYTDILVENLSWIGTEGLRPVNAGSTIFLGNALNSGIRNNFFYRTHEYTATIGGFGTSGFYAENSDITGNRFIGIGSQVVVLLSAKNVRIANNYFDQRNSNNTPTYSVIDLEANNVADRVENIVVENNQMDMRDRDNTTGRVSSAINVQGVGEGSVKNVVIRNNTITAADMGAAHIGNMANGISAYGISELEIYGNHIRGGYQGGIVTRSNRFMQLHSNTVSQSSDVNGGAGGQISIDGVSDSDIYNNVINPGSTAYPVYTGIVETEGLYTITASGSTATSIQGNRIYDHFVGKTFTINNVDYVANGYSSDVNLTFTAAIGSYPTRTFTSSPTTVIIGTDNIDYGSAHGYNTGARVYYSPGTTAIGGLSAGIYFVISTGANTFRLATTLADAIGTTPFIDLTSTGTGDQSFNLSMRSKLSNNTYSNNKAADGVTLESTGTSEILSTFDDNKITNVADVNYTALRNSGIIVYTSLTFGRTVTLPSCVGLRGKSIIIKDGTGTAGVNNITIDGVGTETIDGAATVPINANYGSKRIKCTTGGAWLTL